MIQKYAFSNTLFCFSGLSSYNWKTKFQRRPFLNESIGPFWATFVLLFTELDRCHELLEGKKKSISVEKVMAVIEANQALKRKVVATKYDDQKDIPNGKSDYKLRSLSMEGFQSEFVNVNLPSTNLQVTRHHKPFWYPLFKFLTGNKVSI